MILMIRAQSPRLLLTEPPEEKRRQTLGDSNLLNETPIFFSQ